MLIVGSWVFLFVESWGGGENIKAAVRDLLDKKVKMSEADKAPKVDVINQYIEEKLTYYKALVEKMDDDRNPDWNELEDAFRNTLKL